MPVELRDIPSRRCEVQIILIAATALHPLPQSMVSWFADELGEAKYRSVPLLPC